MISRMMVAAGLCMLAGCATLTDTNEQLVTVHAIADHREIGGVGCLLENGAGRWFVMAPGRVTIRKNAGPLKVDCKKAGAGSGNETVASTFDTGSLIGNVVISAGLGYWVDKRSGAGFDYPATLTVVMRKPEGDQPAAVAETAELY